MRNENVRLRMYMKDCGINLCKLRNVIPSELGMKVSPIMLRDILGRRMDGRNKVRSRLRFLELLAKISKEKGKRMT